MIFEEVRITKKKNSIIETIVKGPRGEDIDSFILTFRFFIQNNEPSSILNLSKIYNEPNIPINLTEEFTKLRDDLNKYLNEWVLNCRVKNSNTK